MNLKDLSNNELKQFIKDCEFKVSSLNNEQMALKIL